MGAVRMMLTKNFLDVEQELITLDQSPEVMHIGQAPEQLHKTRDTDLGRDRIRGSVCLPPGSTRSVMKSNAQEETTRDLLIREQGPEEQEQEKRLPQLRTTDPPTGIETSLTSAIKHATEAHRDPAAPCADVSSWLLRSAYGHEGLVRR